MDILSKFFGMFPRSLRELKSVKCISVTAMLIALNIALKILVTIPLSANLIISFSFLALASIGMLYGPVVSLIAGFITDILGFYFANKTGGAFDIRFTLVEMTAGLLYGMFLYGVRPGKVFFAGDKIKVPFMQRLSSDGWFVYRVIMGKAAVVLICNLLMTSYFNYTYTSMSKTFWVYNIPRIGKNLAQYPVDVVLLLIVLPAIYLTAVRAGVVQKRAETVTESTQKKPAFSQIAAAIAGFVTGFAAVGVGVYYMITLSF